ncbi:hypothetical protein GJ699_02275 [Duganella sp. FT80W]|uniref:Uncharacterized protein n=1 Tax=Duganella guangzhouensis TaxID=2666084 RepID=A0A6I2KUQ5_9BURK|nr:hypothetical protein [Duganella guangzhouensis]MRW88807.1 hypothetical protein [Duganella guangzhouensis]
MTDLQLGLKAYEVREPNEGHCVIVFANNGAAARREGANELDCGFGEVEHCKRKPQFDAYAPGPVPHAVLIDHGWWFECQQCSRKVSEDMWQEAEDEGEDHEHLGITTSGRSVYCSQRCVMTEFVERRAHKAAEVALIEYFATEYPECQITGAHVSGPLVSGPDKRGHAQSLVYFKFPGGEYGATFVFGDGFRVNRTDLPAYYAWRGVEPPAEVA